MDYKVEDFLIVVKRVRYIYGLFLLFCVLITNEVTGAPSLKASQKNYADNKILIQIVKPISDKKILPNTLPLKKTPGVIEIAACRGEFEPASFILRSNTKIQNLEVIPGVLKGDSGVIPEEKITIKVVKVWYQDISAWKGIYKGASVRRNIFDRSEKVPVLVPELLVNDDSLIKVDYKEQKNFLKLSFPKGNQYVPISSPSVMEKRVIHKNSEYPVIDAKSIAPLTLYKNETKQLWITVHVPEDANFGVYKGVIELKVAKKLLGKINIKLEVLPFDLSQSKLTYSLYYRGRLWEGGGTISSEYKSPDQLRDDLINMRNHGIENPTVYQLNYDRIGPPRPGKKQEFEFLKNYLAIREEVKISNRQLFLAKATGNTTDKRRLDKLNTTVRELKNLGKNFGVSELFLFGEDEAKGKALISQRSAWEQVHKSGGKIFAAGSKKNYQPMADLTDILVLHGTLSRKDARKIHSLGNKIFSYHNPQSGPENPLVFRRNYGVALWQAEYDGAMNYAYQHSGLGSIWNDFDHKKIRDHNFTYPTVNGPLDTLAWEGFREGVDDVRYISTLENVIKLAESSVDKGNKFYIKSAQTYLSNLKRGSGSVIDLDKVRRELIKHIVQLCESTCELKKAVLFR